MQEQSSSYIQQPLELEFPQSLLPASSDQRDVRRLQEGLAPYIDRRKLRRLAATGNTLHKALRSDTPPPEVLALIDTLSALLRPSGRERVKSPQDVAALLMVEMGHLDQEELRTVLLDTKNQVVDITTVYRGSLDTAVVRVGEVFKAALRRNCAAIVVAHNHPSGDPEPSPEDVILTQQLVKAGELLDCQVLDHLVIGQGRWVSLCERRLGFP